MNPKNALLIGARYFTALILAFACILLGLFALTIVFGFCIGFLYLLSIIPDGLIPALQLALIAGFIIFCLIYFMVNIAQSLKEYYGWK